MSKSITTTLESNQQQHIQLNMSNNSNASQSKTDIDIPQLKKQIQQLKTLSLEQDEEWEQIASQVSKALSTMRYKWNQLDQLRKSQTKVVKPSNRGGPRRKSKRNI